jgi:hypothetical protein
MSHLRDCRPKLSDEAGVPLPDANLHVRAVAAMWSKTTKAERRAYHRVACLRGSDPADVSVVQDLMRRIKAALDDTPCCRAAAARTPS